MEHADIIIVGAGLSGTLAAWRVLAVNPKTSVTLIEAADKIGGDKTWVFNWSDLTPEVQPWAKDFITHQWDKYDVKFPNRERRVDITYCTGNSDSLRACIQPFIDSGKLNVLLGTEAAQTSADSVTLENGKVLKAGWVLDARGPESKDTNYLGYKRLASRTIKTKQPHGLEYPIIMDAAINQMGGHRFVSCLPFTQHEVMVTETYYTEEESLPQSAVQARLESYIQDKGWGDNKTLHQENGLLPIKLAIESERFDEWAHESGRATPIGSRAGYSHALTGNSLPQAMKSAWLIADQIKEDGGKLGAAQKEMDQHEFDHYCEEKFLRSLNRTLFRGPKPEDRYKAFQKFYGLPEDLIERFLAGKYSRKDQLRILLSRPLMPLNKAFKEARFIAAEKAN